MKTECIKCNFNKMVRRNEHIVLLRIKPDLIRNEELSLRRVMSLWNEELYLLEELSLRDEELCPLGRNISFEFNSCFNFQESFRSLYKELFGENVYKEVEEELSENCIFYQRLYKNLSFLFHLLLKFIFVMKYILMIKKCLRVLIFAVCDQSFIKMIEFEKDVIRRITLKWLKWRSASVVLYDPRKPMKLKDKILWNGYKIFYAL